MLIITAAAVFIKTASVTYLVLYNADTGERYITEKAEEGMMFSVEFIHSVNKTPVKDTFIIENGEIRAYSTLYRSFGAGVQTALEGNQKMTYDEQGNMIITGFDITYDPLRYCVGTVSDHILTLGGEEISLRNMCGRSERVVFETVTGFEILTKGM
ncbi:MAG: DUF1850 domain-containing protein [Clostridia bacterium]|nr:DUF1850 domain-containing protein [Clostridia bacterium]MBQ6932342.1 DUF1850 domain-containing protein [Clostridia bacterium]